MATTTSKAAAATSKASTGVKKGFPTWAKVSVGVGVVALTAWGAWALWDARPPAPDGNPEAVAKYVASERFAGLPTDRQRAYIESLNWEKLRELAPEDRRAVFEVIREFREMETVRNYIAMTPEQRRAHLDEVIREQEARRAEMERRRAEWMAQRPPGAEGQGERPGRPPGADGQGPGQGRPPGGPGGRNSPEREKARLENRDPGMRAAMAQYRADMAQRRAELGLPPRGGPGGGGWSGRGPGGGGGGSNAGGAGGGGGSGASGTR